MTSRKRFWMILSAGVGLAVLLSGVAIGWITLDFVSECQTSNWPHQKFDAQEWQSNKKEGRYVFVRDIVESGKFLGKDAEEIIASLGAPDYRADANIDYVVRDFPDGGCGLNAIAALRLHLGEDGQADKISIIYD